MSVIALRLLPLLTFVWASLPLGRFEVQELAVRGQLDDVVASDVDEDGLEDLICLHRKELGRQVVRLITIFWQHKTAGFAPGESITFEADRTACAVLFDDLLPAQGKEICFITPKGAFARAWTKRGLSRTEVPIISTETFFDLPAPELSWWDLSLDLDENGRVDIILPLKNGYAAYYQDAPGQFVAKGRIDVPSRQLFGPLVESMFLQRLLSFRSWLPRALPRDVDADGRVDLLAWKEGGVSAFIQQRDGQFAEDTRHRLDVQAVRGKVEGPDAFKNIRACAEDVNRDGRADLIVSKLQGQLGLFESMRSQQILFLGRPEGYRSSHPDHIVNLRGVALDPVLVDVNADGNRDLVVSSVRTDMLENIKRAIFKSVMITHFLFLYQGKGHFSPDPDVERTVEIDLERMEGLGTIPSLRFDGDFDGDGTGDLLSLEDQGTVHLERGERSLGFFGGRYFEYNQDRRQSLQVSTSNSLKFRDLNHDGRTDILFSHRSSGEAGKGKISIVLSRAP